MKLSAPGHQNKIIVMVNIKENYFFQQTIKTDHVWIVIEIHNKLNVNPLVLKLSVQSNIQAVC